MVRNWFRDRLTEIKQTSKMWTSFADSVQLLIEEFVEPWLERLRKRVSIFEMDPEDLAVVVDELGPFFSLKNVAVDDQPLIVMQREDEIHQKLTVYPLYGTLKREFNGKDVKLSPLYAPVSDSYPYGSLFFKKDSLSITYNGESYLTSRCVITVPADQLGDGSLCSIDKIKEFTDVVEQVVIPLLPLRIVCHGVEISEVSNAEISICGYVKFQCIMRVGGLGEIKDLNACSFVATAMATKISIELITTEN